MATHELTNLRRPTSWTGAGPGCEQDRRCVNPLDTAAAGSATSTQRGRRGRRRPGRSLLLHAFPLSGRDVAAAAGRGAGRLALHRPRPQGVRPVATPGRTGRAGVHPDDYADDVLALLDALGVDRVVVARVVDGRLRGVRRSCGPGRNGCAALVLADTRAEADGESARAARDAMIETLARGGAPAVFERMLPGLLGRDHAGLAAGGRRAGSRPRAVAAGRGIRRGIERLKSRPDSTPLLGRITCPTLVVVGEEDQITTPTSLAVCTTASRARPLAVIPERRSPVEPRAAGRVQRGARGVPASQLIGRQ